MLITLIAVVAFTAGMWFHCWGWGEYKRPGYRDRNTR